MWGWYIVTHSRSCFTHSLTQIFLRSYRKESQEEDADPSQVGTCYLLSISPFMQHQKYIPPKTIKKQQPPPVFEIRYAAADSHHLRQPFYFFFWYIQVPWPSHCSCCSGWPSQACSKVRTLTASCPFWLAASSYSSRRRRRWLIIYSSGYIQTRRRCWCIQLKRPTGGK